MPAHLPEWLWDSLRSRPGLDRLASSAVSYLTGWEGYERAGERAGPDPRLVLFDRERDPACRRVRQALSALDLPCLVVPTSATGSGPERLAAPLLQDEETGDVLHGAEAILRHLHGRYGAGRPAEVAGPEGAETWWARTAALLRPPRRPRGAGPPPPLPLELWGVEACPETRRVRERLHDLGLPYHAIPVPRGSERTIALYERAGSLDTPFLVDPNHGDAQRTDADPICAYLESRYGAAAAGRALTADPPTPARGRSE